MSLVSVRASTRKALNPRVTMLNDEELKTISKLKPKLAAALDLKNYTKRKSGNMGKTNRSFRGLFQNATIGFGHHVSHSEVKAKRMFKMNVHWVRHHSEVLNETFRVWTTNRALRTIEKYGGLDDYLLKMSNKKLGEGFAVGLKARIKETIRTGVDPMRK